MSTLIADVNDVFFERVLEDPDFFEFLNVPDVEVEELLRLNALDFLRQGIKELYKYTTPDIDFRVWSQDKTAIVEDLTDIEIELLADLMLGAYLKKSVAGLNTNNQYFTSNEIKAFSPAEERRTFMDMYKIIKKENKDTIQSYGSRDRITNARKSIV